jgi:glycosyltransferase involved in cell wall biosynthesis
MGPEQANLRILQVLEKNGFNTGSVHQMFQASTGLAERGHEVMVVSRSGSELEETTRAAGLGFRAFPFLHELDVGTIRGLGRLVASFAPDVIHVHKGLSHTLALAATWNRRVPAFVVNRGVSFGLTVWNRAKYRTSRVDRVVVVCDRIRDVVVRTGKVDWERVSVVYAGTDTELFYPGRWSRETFRKEKGVPSEAFLVMQVGVRDWKGWRELLEGFAVVAAGPRDMRLAMVACRDANEREMVAGHARRLGVGEKVIPVEYRDDMPNVLAAADCVVDASWSGTGITGTIREAMSLAKPVVATDCGGNRELVSSSRYGWLVPPRDRDALVAALRDVMGSEERAGEIGTAARHRVATMFSRPARIDRLESIYREIIGRKNPDRSV